MSQGLSICPILEEKKDGQFLYIAGPCSAESRDQVLTTARLLSQIGKIDLFRCGVWKPRSSPNSFEGAGREALHWLREVEETLHLPVATEVATAQHLEEALTAGIRHFWIGARTSVNPFAVQEIANAAQGTNIGMMLKNPLSADLGLWFGNFERFVKAGIVRLAGIYRGFATPYPHAYRNDPAWQMLIEFKRLHKEIPLFFDPSHIAGDVRYIPELMQKALLLCADGFMTEVHHNPAAALSDKNQQMTVEFYRQTVDRLRMPELHLDSQEMLHKQRVVINNIDRQLIELLGERFGVIREIAVCKKENNLSIFQPNRWDEVKKNALELSKKRNINPDFTTQFLDLLHEYSIKEQEKEKR